jgi:hypothetical protein
MGSVIASSFGIMWLRTVALALAFAGAWLPAVAFAQPKGSVLDAVQIEGDLLWFKLQLDRAAGPGGASFDVRTVDGTAIAQQDYRPLASQTVTIPAGERDADIYVMALQDQQAEPDETLRLDVQPISGADPAPFSATGIITDASTTLPGIDVQVSDVLEGDIGAKPMVFTFRLSEPSARTVAFMYQTLGGNGGHEEVVGRAFFAPGETVATVLIQVYGDTEYENEERVFLYLFDPINATLAVTHASGAILDDDRLPYIEVRDLAIVEGDAGTREATIEVALDVPPHREVRVDYATSDGTAMSDEDYIAVSGALVFAPGERLKTVTVPIRGDLDDERTESFRLRLSNPVGAEIGNHGNVYIVTDDGGPRAIQPPTLPDGALGERYDQLFYVEGEIGAQFEIVSGALPPGIALTLFNGRTYAIGVPTTTGTYAFDLAARLGSAPGDWLAQRSYTLTIGGPRLALPASTLAPARYREDYDVAIGPAINGIQPYRYAASGGALPPGLSVTEAGRIVGIPQSSGSFAFTVTVSDSSPTGPYTASREYSLQVLPPVLRVEALDPLSGTEGEPFETRFAVIGGSNDPFRFALAAGTLPAGLQMDENGRIEGIALESGDFPITVTVTDSTVSVPGSGSAEFILQIEPAALRLAPSTLSRAVVGTFYSQTFTVSGGEGPYEFELLGGELPSGLTLQADGRLVGTPDTAGRYDFAVLVRDLASVNGLLEGWTFTLRVDAAGLQFPTAQLAPASAGVPYQATLSAQGGVAPYRYAVVDGALPAGIALGDDGVLAGTPQTAGTFHFQVRAIDAAGAMVVANPLHTLVVGLPGLRLGPARPQPAVVGSDYSLALQAEGGQAPYRYAVVAGALPAGLTMGENGVIAGVPQSAGNHVVTIAATDASATFGPLRGTLEYTLVVESAVEPAAAAGTPPSDPIAGAPVAASRTLELWAGSAATVDLTAGAQGGPFTDADVVSLSPVSLGSVTIERGAGGPLLHFVPAAQAAGRIELRYTLRSAHGVSAPATIVFVLRALPDPAREARVQRALDLQLRSARRFADAQIGNVRDRLERVRDRDAFGGFDNGLRMLAARPCTPTVGAIPGRACGFEREPREPPSQRPHRANAAFGLWAAGTVRPANHDGRNGADRLGFETDGVSVGADFRPGARSVLGFGVGYARDGGAFAADDDGRSRSEALGLTVYGGLRLGERGFVDALVGQQRLGFDLRAGDDADGAAWHGWREGDQWFAALSAGADFNRAGWRVVPYARLQTSRLRLSGYVESFAGGANVVAPSESSRLPPLIYAPFDVADSSLDLGLRIEHRRETAWGAFAPHLRAEYRRDLDARGEQSLRYADLPAGEVYRTTIDGFSRRRLELSAGLHLDFGRGWSLTLDGRASFGDETRAQDRSLQVGVQTRF